MAGFAIAPMILSTLASGVNMMNQSKVNTENLKNQNALQQRAFSYQDQNNINMYSTLRKSLEKAGLNVNSNFGGYPTTSAPSSPLANMEASQVDATGAGNLLQQAPLVHSQVSLTDAQVAKTEMETRLLEAQLENFGYKNKKDAFDTDDRRMETAYNASMGEKFANIGKAHSEISLNELKRDYQYWENCYQQETYEERKETLHENLEYIRSSKALTDEQKKTETAKQSEAYASATEKRAAARMHDAQTRETIELLDPKKQKMLADSGLSEANQLLVLYKASIAENDADWRDIENFLKNAGLGGKSVKGIVGMLRKAHSAMK